MEPKILYEDEYLLAIDKPSGMVVNRGFGAMDTVQDWVDQRVLPRVFPHENPQGDPFVGAPLPASPADFVNRSGVVHRLDKETSGVLLIAKALEAFQELQRQFKDREVEKMYVGLVHGHMEPESGTIDAPIGRNPKNRMKFGVVEGGREAVTHYRVIAHFSARPEEREDYTLVEFYPKTGRTHQIRVHAKHIGHPIVADYQYAGRKTTRRDRKWCPRLFLHAAKLTFRHPQTGERMIVEAPLPEDLKSVLASLSGRHVS